MNSFSARGSAEFIVRLCNLCQIVNDVVHVERAHIDMCCQLRTFHLRDLHTGRTVDNQAHGAMLVAAEVGQICRTLSVAGLV